MKNVAYVEHDVGKLPFFTWSGLSSNSPRGREETESTRPSALACQLDKRPYCNGQKPTTSFRSTAANKRYAYAVAEYAKIYGNATVCLALLTQYLEIWGHQEDPRVITTKQPEKWGGLVALAIMTRRSCLQLRQ